MKSGEPGPEGSLGKWLWADINQALTTLAMDAQGPGRAARRRHLDLPLPARPRELDRGRDDRDPQEHRRRASAGAAARMNFDLTEDQREIKRTAREFLASRYTLEKIRAIALDGAAGPALGRDRRARLAGHRRARDRRARRRGRGARLRAGAVAAGRALGGASSCTRGWRAAGRWRCGTPTAAPTRSTRPEGRAADRREDRRAERRRRRHAHRHRRGRPRTSRSPRRDATIEPARALDPTRPLFTVRFDGARRGAHRRPLGARLARDRGRRRRRVRRRRRARDADGRRVRQGAQAVRPPDRLLPGRLPRLRADVPRDRGRPQRRPLGRLGARPRPRDARSWPPTAPRPTRATPRSTSAAQRCRSTAGSASPGSTTCTCSSSAPRPTPTRSATPRWHREQVAAALL